ncbi:MAG: nucleotide pyrophosphohydrolase [Candidatus Hermodarchaeota archaeon]
MSLSDAETPLILLKERIQTFIAERGWEKYHTPKNIVMSIVIEASELMELFQWLSEAESLDLAKNSNKKTLIEEEMADILAYLFSLANVLEIDLAKAFERKMEKNEKKYSASESFGTWKKG